MADAEDDWSTNANEALTISLVSPVASEIKNIASFRSSYTYPIFGEEESIFGYQGLKLNLRFNASDMRPHFGFTFKKKFAAVGDTEPADIKEAIEEFLPPVAFAKSSEFETAIKQTDGEWTPPGSLVTSLSADSSNYEVWSGSLADPAIKQFMNRIQILVSLFIEAGTPIQLESTAEIEADPLDRWTVFFLFKKQDSIAGTNVSPYVFAGYATVYRFYLYQPPTPPSSPSRAGNDVAEQKQFELPTSSVPFSEFTCRSRISQFIILPPFQKMGNGARLYDTIFKTLLDDSKTIEITVEAPSEDFDTLRDLSDLEFLRAQPEFQQLKFNRNVKLVRKGAMPRDILDKVALAKLRHKTKIAPRQFARLVEMQLMSKLADSVRVALPPVENPPKATSSDEWEYRLWKLFAKSRLYVHNKDALGQMKANERVEALDDVLSGVELEFAKILDKFETQSKRSGSIGIAKRKLEGDDAEESVSKKARTAA